MGREHSRGTALMPDWAQGWRSTREAGRLMGRLGDATQEAREKPVSNGTGPRGDLRFRVIRRLD